MIRALTNVSALANETTPAATTGEQLLNMGDKTKFALENSLLGVMIVFSVLVLMFIIVKIVSSVMVGRKEKKEESMPSEAPAPAPAATVAPTPVPAVATVSDGELVAAITAAISLMLEAEGKDPRGFRVVSFRRSSSRK